MATTDTVLIPRFGVTVNKVIDRAIVKSIGDLGYEKPRQYQIDVLFKFVSGRDICLYAHWKWEKHLFCQHAYRI